MTPTIKDVAEKAGVSLSTASRALNNTGRISAKTREKVLNIAKELNYSPNVLASSLRSSRSNIIGVIFSNLFAGHFFTDIYRGIEASAAENNLFISMGCSNNDEKREKKLIDMFLSMQIDGFIISPTITSKSAVFNKLHENNIPFVFIDRYVENVPHSFVGTDNFEGGRQSARHMHSLGHKKIAMLLGWESEKNNMSDSDIVTVGNMGVRPTSIMERYDGIRSEFSLNGITPFIMDTFDEHKSSYEYGYQSVKRNIALFKDQGYTALIAMTDSLATGAYKAFMEEGMQVGRDVAVIGYNNDPVCNYMVPALTTVEQYKYDIGFQATNLLVQHINNNKLPEQRVTLPVKVIERASTFKLRQ